MDNQTHLSRAHKQPARVYDPSGIAPTLSAQEAQGRYNIITEPKSALWHSRGMETRKDDVSHCLKGGGGGSSKNFVVYGATTTTDMSTKSIKQDSERKTITQVTLGESIQQKYPTSISFARDFHAKRFQLPDRGKVSRTLVERFSSRYAELQNIIDLYCYSWRMLKDYLAMKEEKPSASYSSPWKSWGIGGNTRFLTASISGFPRIGKECSLSDILEEEVHSRYFLSQKAKQFLNRRREENKKAGRGFGAVFLQQSTADTGRLETRENPTSSTTSTEDSKKKNPESSETTAPPSEPPKEEDIFP
jgi:hypothetical protein